MVTWAVQSMLGYYQAHVIAVGSVLSDGEPLWQSFIKMANWAFNLISKHTEGQTHIFDDKQADAIAS